MMDYFNSFESHMVSQIKGFQQNCFILSNKLKNQPAIKEAWGLKPLYQICTLHILRQRLGNLSENKKTSVKKYLPVDCPSSKSTNKVALKTPKFLNYPLY